MNMAYQNSGQLNFGMGNAGDYNSGDYNSGNRNGGNFNSGDFNLGDYNSGDFNLTDGSSGVFCTAPQKIYFFDKRTDINIEQWRESEGYALLCGIRCVLYDGRNVQRKDFKTACRDFWNNLNSAEKKIITELPNFSRQKFYMITGIDVYK